MRYATYSEVSYRGSAIAIIRIIVLVGGDIPVHVNKNDVVIMNVIDFMKGPCSPRPIRSASKV